MTCLFAFSPSPIHLSTLSCFRLSYLYSSLGAFVGYLGPRPQGTAGECVFAFVPISRLDLPSPTPSPSYADGEGKHHATSPSRNSSSTPVSQTQIPGKGSIITMGDPFVHLEVRRSLHSRLQYTGRVRNFKKPSSKVVGGYLTSDGNGLDIVLEIRPHDSCLGHVTMTCHRRGEDARTQVDLPTKHPLEGFGAAVGRYVPDPDDIVLNTIVSLSLLRLYHDQLVLRHFA